MMTGDGLHVPHFRIKIDADWSELATGSLSIRSLKISKIHFLFTVDPAMFYHSIDKYKKIAYYWLKQISILLTTVQHIDRDRGTATERKLDQS